MSRFSISLRNTLKSDRISGFSSLIFALSAENTTEGGEEERSTGHRFAVVV